MPALTSIVVQQVDLYHPTLRQPRVTLSALNSLRLVLFALAALVGWYAMGEQSHEQLASQLAELQQRTTQLNEQQTALEATLAPRTRAVDMEQEKLGLLAERETRLALLGRLRSEANSHASPLSSYFEGLSRGVPAGLWLESIDINPSSGDIALSGQASDPAQLPQLIRQLGDQPAFRGAVFNVATLKRADDKRPDSPLLFTLSSQAKSHSDETP